MEVAGRGLEPPSPSYLAERAAGQEGLGEGRCGAGTPELLALPLSLSFPSQGANQSGDRDVRGPRELGGPVFHVGTGCEGPMPASCP